MVYRLNTEFMGFVPRERGRDVAVTDDFSTRCEVALHQGMDRFVVVQHDMRRPIGNGGLGRYTSNESPV